jgi:hypothetical protein
MHHLHSHLENMADGPRMLFRSAHIYLLFASLLNLLLATYGKPTPNPTNQAQTSTRLQLCGSVLILLSPLLIGFSFFYESQQPNLVRPYARYGIYAALAGTLLHGCSQIARRRLAKEAS